MRPAGAPRRRSTRDRLRVSATRPRSSGNADVAKCEGATEWAWAQGFLDARSLVVIEHPGMLVDDAGIAWAVGVPSNDSFVLVAIHVTESAKAGMDSLVRQIP